ncbi:MAG: ATP-binding protein [Deltaproteobacteria bacterium]|nr:ATP-binding protein [Deltaproteobacteria bacterium]
MKSSITHSLRSKLLALMVLRVVLAVAFLGLTVWLQHKTFLIEDYKLFYPIYAVVVLMGVLTIVYAAFLNRIGSLKLFAYAQVTGDVLLTTLIVYVTGAVDSYLSVLYPLTVIGGAIILGKRGGYYAALLSSLFYAILIDFDYYNLLPYKYKVFNSVASSISWEDMLTTISTNILSFIVVAYLSGYIAARMARMEKELFEKEIDFEKLEKLNRHIVDNIPTGVMTLDELGRITSFNKAASDITGLALRDVYFRTVAEVFDGLDVASLFDKEKVKRVELEYVARNGQRRTLGFELSRGEERELHTVAIFEDLSDIKRLEERLRRDDRLKALGELSASIAHEVRNPLASISGSIHVLNNELKLDGDKRHLMEIVVRETERLNALITDFLVFAKPAKGRFESFDLNIVVDETAKVFANNQDAGNITIEQSLLPSPLVVDGDRRQISQVFWNLFVNAASAMPGGGSLRLSSRTMNGSQNAAVVEIADSGTGIKPEDIGRIFDPFFSTKEAGTGLGLAIVHRIVESHGGEIHVESRLGKGTTFSVSLPLSREAKAMQQSEAVH